MLEGKFVTLKILEKNEIEQVRQWRNTPELYRHFASRDFITEPQQDNWFQHKAAAKDSLFLMISHRKSGQRIGLTHLESISHRNQNACWGIYIALPQYRLGVLAKEAALLLFNYGFGYLNLHKIYGNTLAGNSRGRKFHRSIGFVEEAVFKEQVFLDGRFEDLIWIALFRSTWIQGKQKELEKLISEESDPIQG
ncbi:GNAT family N-acetyltransferase [bacterium]|nr:GNAT family N-acetyltransferase [bacterium]